MFQSDCNYSIGLAQKMKKSPLSWWFGYLRQVRKYNLPMVQLLIESFDTNQAIFSQYLTFDPDTLTGEGEFGDTDKQVESMESDLGIGQGWLADMEEGKGGRLAVVGHQEALEKTLRDCIDDVDNAAHSGASRRSNFSQSTGNSTIHLTAAAQLACNHEDHALRNVALLNANSGLQNDLDDERAKLATVMAQVHLLQIQPASHQLGQEDRVDGCEDAPMNMRGGGCHFSNVANSEGLVVALGWAGVGKSSNDFGGITSSSPNNLGVGQGNGASPMAHEVFNSLLGTLVDDPRATPLGGVVHVPSNVSNQVYVCPGRMSHNNIVSQEESFDPSMVHVPSKFLDQVYVCPGRMSHDNIVPQEEKFDPKTHKKVMRMISNPSNGSFR